MTDQGYVHVFDANSKRMMTINRADPNYTLLYKAGNPDNHPNTPLCLKQHRGYTCTREKHPGSYLHVANGVSEVAAVWSDAPDVGEGLI